MVKFLVYLDRRVFVMFALIVALQICVLLIYIDSYAADFVEVVPRLICMGSWPDLY